MTKVVETIIPKVGKCTDIDVSNMKSMKWCQDCDKVLVRSSMFSYNKGIICLNHLKRMYLLFTVVISYCEFTYTVRRSMTHNRIDIIIVIIT